MLKAPAKFLYQVKSIGFSDERQISVSQTSMHQSNQVVSQTECQSRKCLLSTRKPLERYEAWGATNYQKPAIEFSAGFRSYSRRKNLIRSGVKSNCPISSSPLELPQSLQDINLMDYSVCYWIHYIPYWMQKLVNLDLESEKFGFRLSQLFCWEMSGRKFQWKQFVQSSIRGARDSGSVLMQK